MIKLSRTIFALCFCLIATLAPCRAAETGGPVEPDQYEPDNTPAQASVVVLSGEEPQQHNFHAAGDADWVKFYGIAQNIYTVKISGPGPACDAVIEVYNGDGQTLLEEEDDYQAGEPEILDWRCPQDGTYYVKIRNYDSAIYGGSTAYGLSMYYPTGPGGTGFITGMVKNKITGAAIGNAVIRTDGGCSTISNPDGVYFMVHNTGVYNLTATAEECQPFTKQVSVATSETLELNIDMVPVGEPPDNGTDCLFSLLYGERSGEIQKLRAFRDVVLSKSFAGGELIKTYYASSPAIAVMIQGNNPARKIIQGACDILLPLL